MTMPSNLKLCPKTLAGGLNPMNRNACDWGWQGIVAFGSQNVVVVVDTKTLQIIQSLDKHRHPVVRVKWSRENYHHDLMSCYNLRLASADANGKILVWDVDQAFMKAEFADTAKPIIDLEWLSHQDASHDLLAVLHSNSTLILWNADTGTKLWKKTYSDTLLSLAFDPFDAAHVAFLGQECVLFIDDFSVTRQPTSNGKRFYISSPSSNSSDKTRINNKNTLTKRMTRMLVGEPNKLKMSTEESNYVNDCLQLTYHSSRRHHIILLYAREILILDLQINQTVGIIPLDRSGSPFVQIISCYQRDALLCLHENGSIGFRVCRPGVPSPGPGEQEDSLASVAMEMIYDLRCQSDALRVTKHLKVLGMCCCPVGERSVMLIMSDGKALLWELKANAFRGDENSHGTPLMSPLFTPGYQDNKKFIFPSTEAVPVPKRSLASMFGPVDSLSSRQHPVIIKFILSGMANGVNGIPHVVKMCPPLTTKNFSVYKPLLAIGTNTGSIQVADLSMGQIWREFSVHSCQVKGIEWISLTNFLSFAFPQGGNSSLVKNELIVTDTDTGSMHHLRQNKDEESPIDFIRISHLKLYFVIAFKDKPFELWDLKNFVLLREMPKNFPHITALEWSPSHYLKSLRRKDPSADATATAGSTDVISPTNVASESLRLKTKVTLQGAREHFVFTDSDGLLYHFIVEGNVIKEGTKVPPDGGMGSISYIAWKGDVMIMGDVEGNLSLWDLRSRVSKSMPLHRGCIHKIKFAPGKANQKIAVLFGDGAEIWDSKEIKVISSVRCPKEMPKVLDLDWACSGEPVLSFADGSVRVMDVKLKLSCAPMSEQNLAEPFFSPHCQTPKVALTVKYLLQHQPWNDSFKLQLDCLAENFQEVQNQVNEQLSCIDGNVKNYLKVCGTAQRCLQVAQLFGDESEVHFWTVAIHYLETARVKSANENRSSSSGDQESADVGSGDSDDKSVEQVEALESCYDMLCGSVDFKKTQLERLALHEAKRATYDHTRKCAETMILLGQTDRAVQLLLETDSDNEGYYVDSLRACLVASIRSSSASQSTIKLVATNLIASGKLLEGVQLLCLIEKGLDACRYLQTYGEWDRAAWLAKSTLDGPECSEVLRRWVDQLCSSQVNQKSTAILVLLSLAEFHKVIEMLYGMRHFDRATLFIEACREYGVLASNKKTKPIVEAVFLEYARFMMSMGNAAAASHYCKLSGDNGVQLQKEVDVMFDAKK